MARPIHQEIRNTVAWILLATLLMVAALWQAQVSAARELEARHKTLPPPLKTRHALRPPPAVFTGDPVADYIARCEKGLTDREIGWIIEDFKNGGLDLDWRSLTVAIEQVLQHRLAQHRWYHDALVDGLRLDADQSTQVASKLQELFEKENQTFLTERKYRSGPSNVWRDLSKPFYPDARDLIADLSISMTGVPDIPLVTPYLPWKLCQLTPEQEKLTWKQWFLSIEHEKFSMSPQEVAELSGGPLFRLSSPDEGYPIDKSLQNDSPLPNLTFPLLAPQKLIAREDPEDPFFEPSDPSGLSILENVRLMHPCQFKALLLFSPELLPVLQSQLENESR